MAGGFLLRQAITSTNDVFLPIEPFGTNFGEIWMDRKYFFQ